MGQANVRRPSNTFVLDIGCSRCTGNNDLLYSAIRLRVCHHILCIYRHSAGESIPRRSCHWQATFHPVRQRVA